MLLKSKVPIHEQIYNQFKELIKTNSLKRDEKLPSVRELAIELGVNPNTVCRAFVCLENDGYIYSLNKKGYYVKNEPVDINKKEIDFKDLDNCINDYTKSGISIDKVIEYLEGKRGKNND